MIYNKGVATIPGAASGPSRVCRAASLGSGQPHTTMLLVLTLKERFGQQGRVFHAARVTGAGRRGGDWPRAAAWHVGTGFPLADPSRVGCAPQGHTDPVLVMLVCDFRGGLFEELHV